ncbi:MAG: radical SAM protein [Pseudomonadota bacterium]
MCYAMPGKIESVEGDHVAIDYFGQRREAVTDGMEGLVKGDYVYAQNGFIIRKVPHDEALEILETWRGVFDKLKAEDEKQSQPPEKQPADRELSRLLLRTANGARLTDGNLLRLLSSTKAEEIEFMAGTANSIRHRWLDNSCCVHGILEFSNFCKHDCLYCGIRASNKSIRRMRLTAGEIVRASVEAVNVHGFKTLLLQSGDDYSFSDDDLVEIVRRVRSSCGVLIFMSVGERSEECYRRMYAAGARGALLRFETSNPEIYRKLHPTSDYNERIALLHSLARMGYMIATGSLLGLPGQTHRDIIEDIRLAATLKAEMYSFSPIVPSPGTPLENAALPTLDEMIKLISVIRFMVPNARILVTTATEQLSPKARELSLKAGGNSLMLNVTPQAMRAEYNLYPGKVTSDSLQEQIHSTIELLKSIGRAPTDLGR